MPPRIRDRVKGLERIRARDLKPHPQNWRRHYAVQRSHLSAILDEVGFAGAILAYQDDEWGPTIIDGHLRQDTVTPSTKVPVVMLDVTREEARTILASFDPIGALAQADSAQLRLLLADIAVSSEKVAEQLEDLIGLAPELDPNAEWSGMPEFSQEDQTAYRQLVVNFRSPEDFAAFEKLIEQQMTDKTRSIWYPALEWADVRDKRWVDES